MTASITRWRRLRKIRQADRELQTLRKLKKLCFPSEFELSTLILCHQSPQGDLTPLKSVGHSVLAPLVWNELKIQKEKLEKLL